jgi:chromosome segregation ATPase
MIHVNPAIATPIYRQETTISEYELRIQALTTQLRAAQSHTTASEAQLCGMELDRRKLEQQLYALKQENTTLNYRNAEIINVMNALEVGVETLRKEKLAQDRSISELVREKENAEKALCREKEQVTYWSERNGVLSNKCSTLVTQQKETKERLDAADQELTRLKPSYEKMETELRRKTEEQKAASLRLATFESKERIWQKEKQEYESRIKELSGRNSDTSGHRQNNGTCSLSDNQINKLEMLLESMHHHHKATIAALHQRIQSMAGANANGLLYTNGTSDNTPSEDAAVNGIDFALVQTATLTDPDEKPVESNAENDKHI